MSAQPGPSLQFGPFGGRYVAESLMPAVEALGHAWSTAWNDPSFHAEYERILAQYVGRPPRPVTDVAGWEDRPPPPTSEGPP